MLTQPIATRNRKLTLSAQTLRRLQPELSGHVGLGVTNVCEQKNETTESDKCIAGHLR